MKDEQIDSLLLTGVPLRRREKMLRLYSTVDAKQNWLFCFLSVYTVCLLKITSRQNEDKQGGTAGTCEGPAHYSDFIPLVTVNK